MVVGVWFLLDLVLRAGKDGLYVGWSEMGDERVDYSRVLCKWTCCGEELFFDWGMMNQVGTG